MNEFHEILCGCYVFRFDYVHMQVDTKTEKKLRHSSGLILVLWAVGNCCKMTFFRAALWSQSQPELSWLQDQSTKMSSPFKRFTTMPFTRYMYTCPELNLHCAFSSLGRTLKLGILSNLSWLSKWLYNLFFSKNFIQSMESWAQNVVVVRSVQVKSCSVMEMELMVSLRTGMFCLFQISLFSNNLFLRKHIYYQFLVHFRVVGNQIRAWYVSKLHSK